MVLAQKQNYRPMEQDRKPRNKFMQLQVSYFTKEARIYNGAKIALSLSGAGKLDSHMQKNEIRTLPNAIDKDKLKMDYNTKCKIRNYKTLTGKQAELS